MTNLNNALMRSTLMGERIRQRTDVELRDLVASLRAPRFRPLTDLMISERAWNHVSAADIAPKTVFAHPNILRRVPRTSLYYRGIALLPLKRVANIAVPVSAWEDGTRKAPITDSHAKRVARLYNAAISSIIEGAPNWTLENGYRNIIANMGIGLDGTFRNIIGRDAEELIKTRIANWLRDFGLIREENESGTEFLLRRGYSMRFGAEPDILFQRRGRDVATIEIKGGKDPAGALERLGAMQKSFDATPPNCVNMLIAGVITPEMSSRLEHIDMGAVFLLDELSRDGAHWTEFVNEVFYRVVRVMDSIVS